MENFQLSIRSRFKKKIEFLSTIRGKSEEQLLTELVEDYLSRLPEEIFQIDEVEEWRDIPGFEGLYKISTIGRILSTRYGDKIMSLARANGYLQIGLRVNNKISRYLVHRLVALVFIPNPENKPIVNHKNGIRTDNRKVNLEWNTDSENIKHSYLIGMHDRERQTYNGKPIEVTDIETGDVIPFRNMREASKFMGVNYGNVSSACNREKYGERTLKKGKYSVKMIQK